MKFDVAPGFYSPVNKNEGQNGQKRMRDLYGYEGIEEHCWKPSQTGDTEVTGSNERQQKKL